MKNDGAQVVHAGRLTRTFESRSAKGRETVRNAGMLVARHLWGSPLADEKRNRDDDDGSNLAADEPTAVWDANTLREAGLGDLIKKPDSTPPPAATAPDRAGATAPSMVVDAKAAGAPVQHVAAPKAAANSGELGWGSTVALAAGLGAAVYLAIRFLR